MHPHDTMNEVPYGYCQCGCGQKTLVPKKNNRTYGDVKGQPRRFLKGHQTRVRHPVIKPQKCECGCGQETTIYGSHARRFINGHQNNRPLAERFWQKVDRRGPDDCWEWQSNRGLTGYGRFKIDGTNRQAHRISYELTYGPIPEGLYACHKCDNRSCCNPAHLFLGTQSDNMNDCSNKGRHPRVHGESSGKSKLTTADVLAIRNQAAQGMKLTEIAIQFHVTPPNIGHIVHRHTWRHLP